MALLFCPVVVKSAPNIVRTDVIDGNRFMLV